jgi:hypothetical protein
LPLPDDNDVPGLLDRAFLHESWLPRKEGPITVQTHLSARAERGHSADTKAKASTRPTRLVHGFLFHRKIQALCGEEANSGIGGDAHIRIFSAWGAIPHCHSTDRRLSASPRPETRHCAGGLRWAGIISRWPCRVLYPVTTTLVAPRAAADDHGQAAKPLQLRAVSVSVSSSVSRRGARGLNRRITFRVVGSVSEAPDAKDQKRVSN